MIEYVVLYLFGCVFFNFKILFEDLSLANKTFFTYELEHVKCQSQFVYFILGQN